MTAAAPRSRSTVRGCSEVRLHLTERGLAAIQSPRKPKGLSHCIFERLIVEASSQAQNHLSVLADTLTMTPQPRLRHIFRQDTRLCCFAQAPFYRKEVPKEHPTEFTLKRLAHAVN